MTRYFLDTNICVYALHRRMPQVLRRLERASQDELVISTLVAAELAGGVMLSTRVEANRRALEAFLRTMTVEGWGSEAVWHYAEQAARLRRAGTPVGTIDLLLGCQALADSDAVLVTHNVREFQRIEGLRVEDWAAA
ncbi:type II toxin-antitoxin system VapC family toxin [Variovorax rhizosphaerae]|uniref:Ribonuclease VapC n=1 Tax=Variovorax rhizosphaerae TaxID=1836200 RepID=A0ABU8WW34_9BURK